MVSNDPTTDHQAGIFDQPRTVNAIIIALMVICVGLVLADLIYENPHPHFSIETSFGFQAWFGFVAFVVAVFLGRLLRFVIKRPEDYYDPAPDDSIEASTANAGRPIKKKTKQGRRR